MNTPQSHLRVTVGLIIGLLLTCASPSIQLAPAVADEIGLTFERDIRPLFRAHCYDCHGATAEVEGGLDLRLVRLMRAGGDSGPAIEAGKPADSLLLERVQSGDMPPGEVKMSEAEIAILSRWIAAGAETARPEPESIPPGLGITAEERSFWAFQPLEKTTPPAISDLPHTWRAKNPLDVLYIFGALDASGSFDASDASGHRPNLPIDEATAETAADLIGPTAPRRVLILRAYTDLTGLPPTPAEVQTWLEHPGEDWYDALLTHLLASPHYGERWARHWLDTAGYADSEGYTTADAPRQWAWKYRDWVVSSLNQDKPFDRFIMEQLAGDELAGPITGDLTAEQIQLITATGFLRMAADGTGSGANTAEARNQVMADTLKIVGTSLLGLSVQCAQCHDHRYDPIPQTDYFALRAVFEPALDWQAWQIPNARLISLYTAADRQLAAEIESEATVVAAARAEKLAEFMAQALEQELSKIDEPLRTQLRDAYKTPAAERDEAAQQLLKQHPSINITAGNLYQYLPDAPAKLAEFDKQIAEIRGKKPPEAFIRGLVEPSNHVPTTKLFHRGDHQQPKQPIAPTALTVACPEDQLVSFAENDPQLSTTGRRLAFARWLASENNPLFARVIVNRIWLHHFGQGIVSTPGDFGQLGARPSHPALLDWLATEFMANGWSLKYLHRLIMSSALYQQVRGGSVAGPAGPYNHLQRLDAESLRDAMLAASGQLDRQLGGPPVAIKEDETGQTVVADQQPRRSLYIQVRRTQPVAMLQSFDAPVMETNCEVRASSTVATQALMLLNSEFILQQAARLADRAAAEHTPVAAELWQHLPPIPTPHGSAWSYGFGGYDPKTNQVGSFTPLPHWTGSQWQGGNSLPDPRIGWVLLNANGGHPDGPERATIRRWTANKTGSLTLTGRLSHGSPNGDGVRGRIVSSRDGLLGEWVVANSATDTPITMVAVEAGDIIDFITDCRESISSDSYNWPVTLTLQTTDDGEQTFASPADFAGPQESIEKIPSQIVRAWQLAYLREPTDEEFSAALAFVAEQVRTMNQHREAIPSGRGVLRQAMTNLSQALLSSNEFLYIE